MVLLECTHLTAQSALCLKLCARVTPRTVTDIQARESYSTDIRLGKAIAVTYRLGIAKAIAMTHRLGKAIAVTYRLGQAIAMNGVSAHLQLG